MGPRTDHCGACGPEEELLQYGLGSARSTLTMGPAHMGEPLCWAGPIYGDPVLFFLLVLLGFSEGLARRENEPS